MDDLCFTVLLLGVCLWKPHPLPKCEDPLSTTPERFHTTIEGHWVENENGWYLKLSVGTVGFKENHLQAQAIQNLGVQPFVFDLCRVSLLWLQGFHPFSQALADSGTLCRTMPCWMVSPWDSFCLQWCTKTLNKNAWQTTMIFCTTNWKTWNQQIWNWDI